MNIKYLKLFRERFSIVVKNDIFILEDNKGYPQYCSHRNECIFYMFYNFSSRIFRIWYKRKEKRIDKYIEYRWKKYNEKYGTNVT